MIREIEVGPHRMVLDDAHLGGAEFAAALVSASPRKGERLRFAAGAAFFVYELAAVVTCGSGRIARFRLLAGATR